MRGQEPLSRRPGAGVTGPDDDGDTPCPENLFPVPCRVAQIFASPGFDTGAFVRHGAVSNIFENLNDSEVLRTGFRSSVAIEHTWIPDVRKTIACWSVL